MKYSEEDVVNIIKEYDKSKSNVKFSKVIVSLMIFLTILFTASVLYIVYHTGNEPSTLIGAWFSFATGELWLLSRIKVKEVENEY